MFPIHDDNPTSRTPYVTIGLITACSLIFLWQVGHNEAAQQRIVYALGVVPATLLTEMQRGGAIAWVPDGVTVVTSMFLHGGWMHLIMNMLYLWIFGDNVEDAMGRGRFVLFYLLCGAVAVFAHALPDADSQIPMIGASGAISGVLGAYLLLYPRARVLVAIPLGFIIHATYIPAMAVLGLWFVLQVVNSWLAGETGGGVAWGAHIGGFVAGMALVGLFSRRPLAVKLPHRR